MPNIKNASQIFDSTLLVLLRNSASLEGYVLDVETVMDITHNKLVKNVTPSEITFVQNMYSAYLFLKDSMNDSLITLDTICGLHCICCDRLSDTCGVIRDSDVQLMGTDWQPASINTDKVIQELEILQSREDKLQLGLMLYLYISRIHLFTDGNKRIAGIVFNKILIDNNIGVFSVAPGDTSKFYRLMLHWYESGDAVPIMQFLKCNCITYTYSYAMKYLAKYLLSIGITDVDEQVRLLDQIADDRKCNSAEEVALSLMSDPEIWR